MRGKYIYLPCADDARSERAVVHAVVLYLHVAYEAQQPVMHRLKARRYSQAKNSKSGPCKAREAPISLQTGSQAHSVWPCGSVACGGTGTSDIHDIPNDMGLQQRHAHSDAWHCIILLPKLTS